MSKEIIFLSRINSFQNYNFLPKELPPGIEHTNFLSTKFISAQTKLILSRIVLFLSKEILLELEQNNFFSTEIDSKTEKTKLQSKVYEDLRIKGHVIITFAS